MSGYSVGGIVFWIGAAAALVGFIISVYSLVKGKHGYEVTGAFVGVGVSTGGLALAAVGWLLSERDTQRAFAKLWRSAKGVAEKYPVSHQERGA